MIETPAPLTLSDAIERVKSIAQAPTGPELELESVAGFGRYEGTPPRIELSDDGRSARLLAPLSYIGENGEAWPVTVGAWLDGASIPRAFWTVIGGPFEGKYRNASIVHDHYCIVRTKAARATHRMFHQAMLCSGVAGLKARIMFYAVYRFGPSWPDPAGIEEGLATSAPPRTPLADPAARSIVEDVERIRDEALSIPEIERLADTSDARSTP